MPNIAALITVAAIMFAVLGAITLIAHIYNLNNIKSKTVGDGQHGTARWANKAEITLKKQPKAVYIIENGGYTELTYEEFRRREQICPLYADKLFLPLYGRLMEVSKEDYAEFYRAKRRQKYLDERSADNGDFSYDMLTTDEFSGEDILIAEQPDVCDTVVESIMTDKLRKAILKLTDEEQLLIYRHYYADISGTELAKIYGVSQQAISKRIAKIRAKLKNLLEN